MGLLLLLISHFSFNWIAFATDSARPSLPLVLSLISDALPFALWAVIANEFVRDTAREILGSPERRVRVPQDPGAENEP